MKEEFINYKLKNMTLTSKIAQMIMLDNPNITEMTIQFEQILTHYNFGGFILFNDNLTTPLGTEKLISTIKNSTNIKSFIAIDEEGGRVSRLKKFKSYNYIPSMADIGKTNDPLEAYNIGSYIGFYLNNLGINMNTSPVLDIAPNISNIIIGDRSFGNDPETVTKMALALYAGLKKNKIIAIGKHYPGHGSTNTDSHESLPVVDKSYAELLNHDLIPYIELIKQNIPGIMVGHLLYPNITHLPASISKVLITDILRNKLKHQGLVITDSLKMRSLTNNYSEKDIIIKSINAGADILLMPNDPIKTLNLIYRAVNDGEIDIENINNSTKRILKAKLSYNLLDEEYKSYKKTKKKH